MKRKIKICILLKAIKVGGAEKQAIYLSSVLNRDYDVKLLISKGKEVDNQYKILLDELNIPYKILTGSLIQRVLNLYRFLSKEKFTFIFSYLPSNNFYAGFIGKIIKTPHIIGGIRSSRLSNVKLPVLRFVHNHLSHATIFNNKTGISNLSKLGFRLDKCFYIPNCFFSPTNNYNQTEKANDQISIITVGRFVKDKDLFTSIRVVEYIIKNLNPEFRFEFKIIGYGKIEAKLRKEIQNRGLDNYIKLIIKPEDISLYYSTADIYLCTSINEGLSNTLMEAMSFSLPIVATNAGDNFQLVQDNYNGFLCKKKDINSLAEKLLLLINSKELRIAFGDRGNKILNEKYSAIIFSENYNNFINSRL